MITGAMPLRLIRELLQKSDAEIDRLIKEDGFPVQETWSASKPIRKVFFHPLLTWLNKGAINQAWTTEMLDAELERAQKKIAQRDAARKAAKQTAAAA
jgi:hypothetical protein